MDSILIRPIILGNVSQKLTQLDLQGDATHSWSCYVRPPSANEQLNFINKVIFHLHESFTPNRVTITNPPYETNQKGWGEFCVKVEIHFIDKSIKPITLAHNIRLYPKDSENPKNPVVSEKYEELIFHKPSKKFQEVCKSSNPVRYGLASCHYIKVIEKYGPDLTKKQEKSQLDKLNQICENLEKEISEKQSVNINDNNTMFFNNILI